MKERITIAIHPNTKEASVCNLHTGFFGIGRDGYSFPDDETVYPENRVRVVNYIEETFQEVTTNEKPIHRFQKGHTFWKKSLEARKRNQERNREERPFIPVKNNHPTVKPIALMEYLIKMVTPKNGIVLDPFAGSGSTLVAAKQNGYGYIGIEMESNYIDIINARLNN